MVKKCHRLPDIFTRFVLGTCLRRHSSAVCKHHLVLSSFWKEFSSCSSILSFYSLFLFLSTWTFLFSFLFRVFCLFLYILFLCSLSFFSVNYCFVVVTTSSIILFCPSASGLIWFPTFRHSAIICLFMSLNGDELPCEVCVMTWYKISASNQNGIKTYNVSELCQISETEFILLNSNIIAWHLRPLRS